MPDNKQVDTCRQGKRAGMLGNFFKYAEPIELK